MTEDQATVYAWQRKMFPRSNRAGQEGKLFEEVQELKSDLMYDPKNSGPEMADVVIVLYGLASMLGIDLHEEINKKMDVNRHRTWEIQPDGTGRHL